MRWARRTASRAFRAARQALTGRVGVAPRFDGPRSVLVNLLAGLDRLSEPYRWNPPRWAVTPVVGVLSHPDALRWALAAKRQGRIRHLIAGPNMVVHPCDEGRLIEAPEIDLVLVNSQWTYECYLTELPSLAGRLVIWPSGVDTARFAPDPAVPRTTLLVFRKDVPEALFQGVMAHLEACRIPVTLMTYGQYEIDAYLHNLRQAWGMLYLNTSESQGLALHEAWACDVPTLVWDRGYADIRGQRWLGATAAPYLTARCGATFPDLAAFPAALTAFCAQYRQMDARQYTLEHFTLELSARQYREYCVEGIGDRA